MKNLNKTDSFGNILQIRNRQVDIFSDGRWTRVGHYLQKSDIPTYISHSEEILWEALVHLPHNGVVAVAGAGVKKYTTFPRSQVVGTFELRKGEGLAQIITSPIFSKNG